MTLVTTIVPAIGSVLAILMFLSPLPDIRRVLLTGNLGSLNYIPHGVLFVNCLGWIAYSVNTHDVAIFICNGVGCLLTGFYFLTCQEAANAEQRRRFRWVISVLSTVMFVGVSVGTFAVNSQHTRQLIFGFLCNAVLLAFYSSPLATIKTVVKSRSAATLSLPLCLTATVNASLWAGYGFALGDPFIYVPNAVGAFLSLIQVVLCCIFRGHSAASPTPDVNGNSGGKHNRYEELKAMGEGDDYEHEVPEVHELHGTDTVVV